MTVTMAHIKSEQPPRPQTRGATLKFITVKLNKLTVALPIDAVDKVIRQTTVLGSGLNPMGVTHYEGNPITVIDLHYQLFQHRQDPIPNQSYLIIAKTGSQKFALPIQGAPNLAEFGKHQLRVLPMSYRRADTLGIASHVVRTISPTGEDTTFFILDMDYLANVHSNTINNPLKTLS
ncbi:MAG: chemotaxis protein CheW [Cyanobacteria bacterium]|nr:chemotaxis protein CheW [Cyanobacteriota bacterium]